MITAVDTNILIDIFSANPNYGHASKQALQRCLHEGIVYACEVVWIETAVLFPEFDDFIKKMDILNINYQPLKQEAIAIASYAWKAYRQAGGKRERIVADFIIGAHAQVQADRLLTRDRGFYRNYFKLLNVLDPMAIV